MSLRATPAKRGPRLKGWGVDRRLGGSDGCEGLPGSSHRAAREWWSRASELVPRPAPQRGRRRGGAGWSSPGRTVRLLPCLIQIAESARHRLVVGSATAQGTVQHNQAAGCAARQPGSQAEPHALGHSPNQHTKMSGMWGDLAQASSH